MLAETALLLLLIGLPLAVVGQLDPSIPSSADPPASAVALDPYLLSLSIEPAYLDLFLGNASAPNELVLALLSELESRTGGIGIRPGGITADSSIYDPSLSAVEKLDTSPSGGVYRTTYGPAFFDALVRLPDSTKFVLCLNFGNDTLEIASDEAKAAMEKLGGQLEALEIGNEPDQFTSAQRNLSNWYAPQYTAEWEDWSSNISSTLNLPEPFFQAGAISMDPTSSARFTTADLVQQGIADSGRVKTFSQHMYQFSTCDPERDALITNVTTLANHTSITNYVDLWQPQVAAAKSANASLVIGEFSSVSCSGKQGVSDAFGAALWLADTYLYSASIGIARMYAHQGATLALQSSSQANTPGFSWYDVVYPQPSERNGPASAAPSFSGLLLVAEALGRASPSSSSAVRHIAHYSLAGAPNLAAYAIWDPAARADGPARVVLLNLSPSPSSVDLRSLVPRGVKRLTGDVQSTDPAQVLWDGQSYAGGMSKGEGRNETIGEDGVVQVGAWEGALVFLGSGVDEQQRNASASAASGTGTAAPEASSSAAQGAGGGTSAAASVLGSLRAVAVTVAVCGLTVLGSLA